MVTYGKSLNLLKQPKEKRWFDPPSYKDIESHLLSEAMLKKHVERQNNLIEGAASSTAVERHPITLIDYQVPNGLIEGGENNGGMVDDLLSMVDDEEDTRDGDNISFN